MGVVSNFRIRFRNLFFTPILYGSIASLALFLSAWETGDRVRDRFQDRFRSKEDTFDFIVVGAGSAGSIVANRLSENFDVLLLEAGGEAHPFSSVPGLSRFLMNYPQVDWRYRTTQQKRSCLLSNNKECSWSGGKGLGGSGNLGLMTYVRGNPKDYDNWARITEDPRWSYDEILPYFKKIEDFIGNSTDPDAHGHGGELRVELPDYINPSREFLWAAHELGYENVDLNGRYTEGFDAMYYSIKKGVRQSPYRAFIKPIRKRKTLTIRKFAHVTKLMLRNNDNGAYGLEYQKHGKLHKAYAHKEIVLSAGAIQTPRILLLSGIGDINHLKDMGLITYIGPFFLRNDEAKTLLLDRDITTGTFLEYGAFGKGPLTISGEMAAGIISSIQSKNRGEGDWPDMKISLQGVGVYKNFAADMAHGYNLKRDTIAEYYKHAIGQESFHMGVSVGRPIARGEIRLTGKNPLTDDIVIDPNYLEDPWDLDLKVMMEGVKTALFMVENTTVYQNLGGRFTNECLPGCEHVKFRSDAYWECYIRKFAVSANDYVGTCAMGKRGKRTAVVDPELRVIGANNLRIIDASVIPSIVVGNAEASVLMLAQKGADMMVNYWKSQEPEDCHEHYSGFANSNRPGKAKGQAKETDNQLDDEELSVQSPQVTKTESLSLENQDLSADSEYITNIHPSSISSSLSKFSEEEEPKPKMKTKPINHASLLSKRMKSSKDRKISNTLRSQTFENKEPPTVLINIPQNIHTIYPVLSLSPKYQLTKALSSQEFSYVVDTEKDKRFNEEKPFEDSVYVVKTKVDKNRLTPLQEINSDYNEQRPMIIIKKKSDHYIPKTSPPKEIPKDVQDNSAGNGHIYLPTYEVSNSENSFAFPPQNSMSSLTGELQQEFTNTNPPVQIQSDFRY